MGRGGAQDCFSFADQEAGWGLRWGVCVLTVKLRVVTHRSE